mgnify:CR=1 FL=1
MAKMEDSRTLKLFARTKKSGEKIEGGRQRQEVVKALLAAEIPVMGHLGLTPQSINRLGGYKVQGKGQVAARALEEEALLLEELGCFSLVLECVPSALAGRITSKLNIPTIGIGAGPECDGQVLVFHDMLGLFDGVRPKFVKRYAELGELARNAVGDFVKEVKEGAFPTALHSFNGEKKADDAPPLEKKAQANGYLNEIDGSED